MKSKVRFIHRIVLVSLLFVLLLGLAACQESTSSKYDKANKLLTEGKYTEAAAIFDEISTYEDASKMSLYTKAINAAETGDYDTAFTTFASLGDFKDCSMLITYYKGRQNEASVYEGAWIYGQKWFDAIEIYESIPLFRDSKDRAENCRIAAFDQAIKSGDKGDTSFAISILKKLGTYSDAAKQVTYYQAVDLLKQGDYSGASTAFSTVPGFRDADNRATSALEEGYKAAAAKEEAGELDEANAIFLSLGEYNDSADRAYKLYYDAGMTRREAKDWDGARAAFGKAGEYSDATEQIKETTYQEAISLMDSGDYTGAYAILINLNGYRDVDDLLETNDNLVAAARKAKYTPGNIVTFGIYPQTKGGTDQTPIEWIVLDYDETNHKALLLSRYGLDAKPYNTEQTDITWEKCTLRTWLNGDFLNKAFGAAEQSAILMTKVDNSKSQGYSEWNTDGGNNTEDRIFLLSYAEANRFLDVTRESKKNMKSRVAPTAYALAQGARIMYSYMTDDGAAAGWWWLRSPGDLKSEAACVGGQGSLSAFDANYDHNVVRPAFWLNLESGIF